MANHLRRPIIDRLIEKIEVKSDGCWIFTGSRSPGGYGRLSAYRVNGKRNAPLYTHRVSYEHFNGPILEGMWIDHLCRNRACCAPDHLEAVTPQINLQRAREANGHVASSSPPRPRKRFTAEELRQRRNAARNAARAAWKVNGHIGPRPG